MQALLAALSVSGQEYLHLNTDSVNNIDRERQ
jgi:hypothetical protein